MRTLLLLLLSGLLAQAVPPQAATDDPASAEFFEKKVRPVLVERCYSCHSATAAKLKGGLRLDSRELLLKGGDTTPRRKEAREAVGASRFATLLRG